jgi:hypothetical protein
MLGVLLLSLQHNYMLASYSMGARLGKETLILYIAGPARIMTSPLHGPPRPAYSIFWPIDCGDVTSYVDHHLSHLDVTSWMKFIVICTKFQHQF